MSSEAKLWELGAVKISELKARYGIARTHAYELMADGKLLYSQVGRNRLVPVSQVLELLAAGMVGAGEPAGTV